MMPSLAVMLLGLTACRTETITTSDGRPMPPDPRPAPVTPADAPVNQLALFVGLKPEDTNGNGFPDQISATAVLFATPHPTPVLAEGDFLFTLYAPGQIDAEDARPLAQWRIENEQAQQAVAVARYGPCYQFRLSLLKHGSDVHPLSRADLIGRFEPADGSPPVRSDGVRSIQIGRGTP